jgi:hypothetical protein
LPSYDVDVEVTGGTVLVRDSLGEILNVKSLDEGGLLTTAPTIRGYVEGVAVRPISFKRKYQRIKDGDTTYGFSFRDLEGVRATLSTEDPLSVPQAIAIKTGRDSVSAYYWFSVGAKVLEFPANILSATKTEKRTKERRRMQGESQMQVSSQL